MSDNDNKIRYIAAMMLTEVITTMTKMFNDDGEFHLMGLSLSLEGLTEIIGNQNIDRHSERSQSIPKEMVGTPLAVKGSFLPHKYVELEYLLCVRVTIDQ